MLSLFSRISWTQPQLQSPTVTKAKGYAGFRLCRGRSIINSMNSSMDGEKLLSTRSKRAKERICLVSSFTTELLELHSEEPSLHILLIPGNPGVVTYYKDFVEALYEMLDGKASITAIGHIAHTRKNWEHGRMFSLQEQVNHKVDFMKQELQCNGPPVILVGHSIGAYIGIEVFKRVPQQVNFTIGLYPFLSLNSSSSKQSMIRMIARSSILNASVSCFASLLGFCPVWVSTGLIKRVLGDSGSSTSVDATCSHLLQFHTVRNAFFMVTTEFAQFSEEPDLSFMKTKQDQIALLYGIDDHWGPLSVYEKISKQAPGITLSLEEEGHPHAFCCTEAGSAWVARHVANLIRRRTSN